MIKENEVTFICAGKIFTKNNLTLKCLKSIKKFFPKSRLILTTCDKKDNFNKFVKYCDEIIYNKAPDNIGLTCLPECDWYPKENSYNHQQLLVNSALKVCQTKYVVKFRTDFVFNKNCFIKFYEKFLDVLGANAQVFKQKVLIYSCGTINPETKHCPLPHHPSDLFFFGLTDDLKLIYDGRFISKEFANYYLLHIHEKNPALFNHLYTPEQFLWLQLLDKLNTKYEKPQNYFDNTIKIKNDTLNLFLANFIIFDQPYLGFKSKFDLKFIYNDKKTRFITTRKFLEYYENKLGSTNKLKHLIYFEDSFCKYNCTLRAIIKHVKTFFKYLSFPLEILSSMYYLILTIFFKIKLSCLEFQKVKNKHNGVI